MTVHPFPPFFDSTSCVLILGSFPSVKSREEMFFYGHPQNRFWRVLAQVFSAEIPRTVEEKRAFLLSRGIALWDVIASCEIRGSADSTIRDVLPNDLRPILAGAQIEKIFVNGRTAEKFYNKYTRQSLGRDAVCLPSTSPANAAWSVERLAESWQQVRDALLLCGRVL